MTTEERLELASKLTAVLERNAYLEEENARLHVRLIAQIAQNGELVRQGRKLDGEAAPEYVTAADYPTASTTL
jgi:hypothetical protein